MRILVGCTTMVFQINAAKITELELDDADVSHTKLEVSVFDNSAEGSPTMYITLTDRDMHNIICAYNHRRILRRKADKNHEG